jgi:hypothetical protein
MENTIKFQEKKIITKIQTEDKIIIETWEPNPSETLPKKQFIIHDNMTYYLISQKEKTI